MYVFTCPNPDCADHGVERLFEFEDYLSELEATAAADPLHEYDKTPHVWCGTCSTEMGVDAGHQVPAGYQPKPQEQQLVDQPEEPRP